MTSNLHKEKIATRLRSAREQGGLTQSQAATMLGMHRPTISEIEAGRRSVSAEELANLARIYGVTTEWLLHGTGKDLKADNQKLLLAARELSKIKEKDLEKLMNAIEMLRGTKGN